MCVCVSFYGAYPVMLYNAEAFCVSQWTKSFFSVNYYPLNMQINPNVTNFLWETLLKPAVEFLWAQLQSHGLAHSVYMDMNN